MARCVRRTSCFLRNQYPNTDLDDYMDLDENVSPVVLTMPPTAHLSGPKTRGSVMMGTNPGPRPVSLQADAWFWTYPSPRKPPWECAPHWLCAAAEVMDRRRKLACVDHIESAFGLKVWVRWYGGPGPGSSGGVVNLERYRVVRRPPGAQHSPRPVGRAGPTL